MKKFVALFFFSLLVVSNGYAQEESKKHKLMPEITGLTQIIGQADVKDFNSESDPAYNNILKVRVGFEKEVYKNFFVKADFQDARLMGHTPRVTDPGDHVFDLIEGYVEAKDIMGSGLGFKAGRFQMKYANQRVLGQSFWNYYERKFDGVMLRYHKDKIKADVFYTYHNDNTPYLLKTLPNLYPTNDILRNNNNVSGAWITGDFGNIGEYHLFAVAENNKTEASELNRYTVGINRFCTNKKFDLKTEIEASYQFGNNKATADKDIAAWHVAVKADKKFNRFNVLAGADIFSGTDPEESDKIGMYSNALGGKHKFLGNMDYFLVLSGGTANLGVHDYFAGVGYSFIPKKLSAGLTGHYFMSNQDSGLDANTFGSEIDFDIVYKPFKGTKVKGGASAFFRDELMENIWGGDEDMSYWTYVMLVVNF